MKRILPLASICAALALTNPILAAGPDPSDVFLKAYMAIQTAEKLETNGKSSEALKQYKFAGGLLDQIRSDSPNWQPLVIEYRSKKTSQKITDLQAQASRDNEFSPLPAPTTGAGASGDGIEPEPVETLPALPGDANFGASPIPQDSPDAVGPAGKVPGSELEALRQQLSEARLEIARRRQENQTLTKKNDQAARNIQEALQRADRNRIEVAELRTQLAQAEDRLQSSTADKATATRDLESARVIIAKLRTQIDQRQADAEFAEDEASDLTGRLAASNAAAAKATTELAAALQEKTAAVEARDKAIADLEKSQAGDAANELVVKANAERDAALKDKEDAVKARDEALASLEKARGDQEKSAQLLADNTALSSKLAAAEKQLANLGEHPATEEVAQLKAQITDVQTQLAAARSQAEDAEKSVADLKTQLAAQTELQEKFLADAKKSGAPSAEVATIQAENSLLRGIVLRGLKEQVKRNQASQVLLEELAKVEGKSQTLLDQVEVIGKINLHLDDRERKLFKDSELAFFDSSAEPSGLSVELTQQSTPAVTAATAAAKATSSIPISNLTASTAISGPRPIEVQVAEKITQAKAATSNGDLNKAERLYSDAIELDGENVEALSSIGGIFIRQRNYSDAEDALQKAVARAPKDFRSRYMLGVVYYRQSKWDAAMRVLRESLEIDPKSAQPYNYLGIAASRKGQNDQAVKDLQKAITLNPKYADAYFNLAVVYATQRPPSLKSARENYEKATSLGAQPDPALEKLIQ